MNSGARNTRSLAETVSSSASHRPATASFAASTGIDSGQRDRVPVVAEGRAPRHEQREADAGVVEQLQRRGPLHQREVPRRVLEQHRLVDHRELEVRRRVVHRDAGVLGEQHHREGDGREREARIQRERLDRRAVRRSAAAPWSREISEATKMTISSAGSARKPIIISRRAPSVPKAVPMSIAASDMNTRAIASRPTSAMASAARTEWQARAHRRNDRGRRNHRAEHDVRRHAEQRRRVLRDHGVLVEQLADAVIRQQQARRTSGSAARRGTR